MRVSEIMSSLSVKAAQVGGDPEITGLAVNSRRSRPGHIFVAIPGTCADGWDYVDDAIRRGAVAIVSERKHDPSLHVCQVVVEDAHTAFSQIAAAISDYPSRDLKVVGITGTNGKTTTSYMVRDVLRAAGTEPGLIGTVAYEVGDRTIVASRTTPDAATLQNLMRQMVSAGCEAAVMEVSSHALVQRRVSGVEFDVAVFTNLTRDHLDYHKTMEAYYEAKALLFRGLAPAASAVVNAEGEWGQRLCREALPCRVLTYSMDGDADVTAEGVVVDIEGCTFTVKTPWGTQEVQLQLLGRHNVSNALACIAACGVLGVDLPDMARALERLASVCGRLEPIRAGQPFSVFVDYAHTDDALSHALMTVRELTAGRVIVVFGCGGDRDRTKRPVMGEVAARLADVVVVTSDNPRSELPSAIIDDILSGVDASAAQIETVEDRALAIEKALALAEAGDTVLIAGKGHETYQECSSRTIPFDDHEVALAALNANRGLSLHSPKDVA